MPVSYTPTEDPQEPSRTAYTALPVRSGGDVPAIPAPGPLAALLDAQDNFSILHRHPNFFVLATSYPDHLAILARVNNSASQEERVDVEVKSAMQKLAVALNVPARSEILFKTLLRRLHPLRGHSEPLLNTNSDVALLSKAQQWRVFSHQISVKSGFPGSESYTTDAPPLAQMIIPYFQKINKNVEMSLLATRVHAWLETFIVILGLMASFAAHAINMFYYPHYEQDEGVYTMSSWAIMHGLITPYPYTYGHPPLAWMQIATWVQFSGGFSTFGTTINSARVLMLLFALGCSLLVYQIARCLGANLGFSLLAMLIFTLSPISITFQREVLLDNVATFWFLLSLYFIVVGKSHLLYITSAAISFGIAFLCKEVVIVLLPVLIYAMWLYTARFQRRFALVAFIYIAVAVCSAWALLAILKGELFPYAWHLPWDHHPHLSLLGTFFGQVQRTQSEGKIIDSLNAWTKLDPLLILFGLAAPVFNLVIGLWSRKHLFLSLFAICYWVFLLRGGVIFAFYIIPLLPFIALNVVLALNTLLNWISKSIRFDLVRALLVFCVIVAIVPYDLQHSVNPINLFTLHPGITQQQALVWVRDHIPRRAMIVISSIYYTDLHEPGSEGVGDGAIYSHAEVFWNAALDPAVHDTLLKDNWDRIDYIVADSETLRDIKTYGGGMLIIYQALMHSVLRAQFSGDDYEFIQIYQVIHKAAPPNS